MCKESNVLWPVLSFFFWVTEKWLQGGGGGVNYQSLLRWLLRREATGLHHSIFARPSFDLSDHRPLRKILSFDKR